MPKPVGSKITTEDHSIMLELEKENIDYGTTQNQLKFLATTYTLLQTELAMKVADLAEKYPEKEPEELVIMAAKIMVPKKVKDVS